MVKGRHRSLTQEEITDIIESFTIDPHLTTREVAFKYLLSKDTVLRILPPELRHRPTKSKKGAS